MSNSWDDDRDEMGDTSLAEESGVPEAPHSPEETREPRNVLRDFEALMRGEHFWDAEGLREHLYHFLNEVSFPEIPGFRVTRLLGSGATSQIFLATREPAEPGRDPLVAIKVPRPEYRDDPDFARRARQGAQTLLGLNHPHVVRIERIDCYPTATCEIPYLVLEYCEGGTLVDLVKAQLPSPREAAVIVSKIAQAIQYLHRSHAIHRDIKPANIVFRENEPKITDFELVRSLLPSCDLTANGTPIGTLGFMSPEMARGENLTLDLVQQDVYGLGAVLYYCLTGVPPHDGGDDHSLRIRIAGEEPVRSPRSLRPEIDPALEAICLAAIHPKPRLRYRSVEAFLGDLRDYLEGKPTYPPRETLWSWTQEFWRGHRWPLIAAASTLFCLLLTAVAWQAQAAAIESRTHRVRSLLSNLADPAPAQEPLRDQLLRVESDLRLLENAQEILSEGSVQPELVTDLAERLAILQQEQDRLKKNLEIERSEAAEVARQERFDRAVQEARFLAALPGPAKTFEGLNHRAAEETFARAFREEYGFVLSPNFDVERTAQELKQHANHRTIAAALLEWMMVRQNQQIEQIERAPWKAILGFQAEQRPIQKLRHLAEVMHRDSPWHRQMHLELANPFILPEKKFIALLDRPELDQIDIGSLLFIIAYITENNPEKGIAALRKILQRQRDNFWVHYYLARSYVHPQTLDLDQAVRHAEAALALHKDNPYALFSLANYLQARGNAEEAEPLLRTAIKARPSLSALLPRM